MAPTRRSKRLRPEPESEKEPETVDEEPLFSDEEGSVHIEHGEEVEDEEDEEAEQEQDEEQEEQVEQEQSFLPFLDLNLKSDHLLRPIVADERGRLWLEAFSPIADQAVDFLVAVAEPVSRPKLIHEYILTEYSLYAAVSVGIQADSIISVLNKLCKTEIPERLIAFIRLHTKSYGKVKLVLKDNHQYVESAFPDVLRLLLQDKVISDARVLLPDSQNLSSMNPSGSGDEGVIVDQIHGFMTRVQTFVPVTFTRPTVGPTTSASGRPSSASTAISTTNIAPAYAPASMNTSSAPKSTAPTTVGPSSLSAEYAAIDKDYIDLFDEDEDPFDSEHVRKACSDKGFPILEEYDFRNDNTLPTLDISLRPAAILRPYQEKSLNKMFGNGRARSGIIVLPCGAGKTLVGVTAACTVKKRVLVLCTSAVSVEQWAREFRSWTNIKDNEVAKFTSQHKELLANDNGILISTYTMVTFSSKRAYDAQKMMDYICSREWGLLILDEVHVVPAEMFRKVLTIVAAHSKLGLTATLVREDDKIGNLNYLIGPKLYEANWLDLAKKGHIANVRCSEVWCTMTKEFYKEYLGQSSRKRQLLYVMNPNKIQACQYLIDFHEQRGDKVIVFSDNVFALKHYATKLNRPYIYGGSSTADRLRTLQQFKYNPSLNTIFLSKVGDTSIDIPEASCLIQISSHYGSRRQEAQRLGRILRAKKGTGGGGGDDGYNSFFYTLVSRDTEEVYYCAKRQQFLIDQGYSYDIITKMEGMDTVAPLVYRTINERLELLATILVSNDMIDLSQFEEEVEDEDAIGLYTGGGGGGSSSGSRFSQTAASMKSLSGADNMAYIEQQRGGLSAEFRKRHRK
ncbi:DNA repair helicase rad25 [Obelidium mucronatum]|nr:DNA repair helicase rad25 [Obelidium mucronatum]